MLCPTQVTISGEELLRFHSPGTFKGPDAQNRQASLQKKPEVCRTSQEVDHGLLCACLLQQLDLRCDSSSVTGVSFELRSAPNEGNRDRLQLPIEFNLTLSFFFSAVGLSLIHI